MRTSTARPYGVVILLLVRVNKVVGDIRADMESAPTVLTTLLLVQFNKVVRNMWADME